MSDRVGQSMYQISRITKARNTLINHEHELREALGHEPASLDDVIEALRRVEQRHQLACSDSSVVELSYSKRHSAGPGHTITIAKDQFDNLELELGSRVHLGEGYVYIICATDEVTPGPGHIDLYIEPET